MHALLKKLITLILVSSFLSSLSHANDFDEGIASFEKGAFRKAGLLLLPLANQGDLYAQAYVTWLREKNKELFAPEEITFSYLKSSFMKTAEQFLEASLVKFVFTFNGVVESRFSNIPTSKKRAGKDLETLLSLSIPWAYVVAGDLTHLKLFRSSHSAEWYYGEALKANYQAAFRLRSFASAPTLSLIVERVCKIVEKGDENGVSRGEVYYYLSHDFKKVKGLREFADGFSLMAAYHGSPQAQADQVAGKPHSEEGDFWIEQAGQQGYAPAFGELGSIYLKRKQHEKALEFYEKARREGSIGYLALHDLGRLYERGQGACLVDLDKALDCYRKAHREAFLEQNHPAAHDISEDIIGTLVKKSDPECLFWLQEGLQKEVPGALTNYALLLLKGTFEEKNPRGALETLRKLKPKGHNPLSLTLLTQLMLGEGLQGESSEWTRVEQFLSERARSKLLRGEDDAVFDFNQACYALYVFYSSERENFKGDNPKKALSYLQKAMENEFPLACFQMGQIYQFGGIGVKKNDAKAFKCYLAASHLGFSESWNNLGVYYMNGGHDIPQDDQRAVACFESALEFDQTGISHDNYARMMRENRGGLIFDEEKWIAIMEKSASLGNAQALLNMMDYSFESKNFDRACSYAERAQNLGLKGSAYNLFFLKIQGSESLEVRLDSIAKLKGLLQEEVNPEILCKVALIFMNKGYTSESRKHLLKAIEQGSEEAEFMLDHSFLREKRYLSSFIPMENAEALTEQQTEEAPLSYLGPLQEQMEAFLEDVEDFEGSEIDYEAFAHAKARGVQRPFEGALGPQAESIDPKILEFLNPGCRQVSVHKVFSILSNLIKEKGGKLEPSTRGISIEIGTKQLFMHLQHGRRGGGHTSKMDGVRLAEVRSLIKEFYAAN